MKVTEQDRQALRAIERELADPNTPPARRDELRDAHELIAGPYVADLILNDEVGKPADAAVPVLEEFPPGTRFFSDDVEPVAVWPGPSGAVVVNFWGGRGVEIPRSEFMRSNPARQISFEEFLSEAGVEAVRDWFARASPSADQETL